MTFEQLRARLADLEGEVVQLKARPAPSIDAESILEDATDGFLVYDSEFRFTYLNGDGERLLEKPRTELLGKTQWDVFPETIGTEIEHQYRRVMKERVATIFESVYPPLETWFEIRVSPSTMGGLLVWLRDITARRQTEMQREGLLREIQAERQILSEIFEKSPVAISVLRAPDFIYELVNPALQALAPGKEILGRRFSDIWGEVSDPLVASLENVIATGRAFDAIDSPRTIQRDPGAPPETIFVTSSWIPLIGPSGSPDRILTLAVETTERKRQEDRLRQRTQELEYSNQQLTGEIAVRKAAEDRLSVQAATLEAAANSIIITDRDGTIQWVNPAFTRVTGYTSEEALGKTPRIPKSGKDAASLYENLRKTIFSGNVWQGEITNRRKDGSLYVEETTITPVRSADGKISNFIGIKVDVTERKRAHEALVESENRYRSLFENMLEGFAHCRMLFDDHGHPIDFTYLAVNSAFGKLTGLENVVGKRVTEVIPGIKESQPELFEIYGRVALTGKPEKFEIKLNALGIWFSISAYGAGNGYFIATFDNVTERKRAELALREAEEQYRTIFEENSIGICYYSTADGRYLNVNPAFARIFGYDSPEEMLARVSDASQLYVDPSRRLEFGRQLREQGECENREFQVYRKDGSKIWLRGRARAVHSADGSVLYYVGAVEDITEHKLLEEQVRYQAYYDTLTGLPNRSLLQDRLAQAMASARRRREKVALLFLDLDRFKTINDSLGHSVGDLLLKEVAERLSKWAREQDTVARLGGDEFVVVLTAVKDIAGAAVAADRLMKAMRTEFTVQGHLLGASCSLGISVFPDHGSDGEALIKNADVAMYCAKENGRNNFQFFTQEMNSRAVERLTLESSLRLAIERKELFLEYQPQVDLATGKITGAEALLRWRHPELGLVPPNKFIPIAENSGLIIPIGEWVLRTACAQARQWQDEGLPALPVAVNVSAIQFRQESFLQVIGKVLHETGLPPQYLELELTEGLLLSNADVMLSVLQKLRESGVKLSIDDFGTGYSSLSYLRHFPVYKLKIDRSFVQAMTVDSDDTAITATIISMAKSLNLKVIAEGVETEQQMLFLRTHNCDEVQGYYFSKPLAAEDFAERLQSTPFLQSDLQTTTPTLLGKRWAKLQWAREAFSYSSRNSRITMEIFLLNDKRLIDPLLANRANNTQNISELVAKLEVQCNSEQEKQLLAAVNNARTPYVASYLKALHLLLDEDKQEAARAIMVQETTPDLFKYHDAWNSFVQFQMEEMDKAANH